MQAIPDRVCTYVGRFIVACKGKGRSARPTLAGYGLLEESKADPSGTVATQLHQLCGHLHHDELAFGLLYTDECFWFARYSQAPPCKPGNGTLYVSMGIVVTQTQRTLFAMLLYVGDLARRHALKAPVVPRGPLRISMPFFGTVLHSSAMAGQQQQQQAAPAHELRMGSVLAISGTGTTVRIGRLGNLDIVMKLPDVPCEDRGAAC